MIRAVFRFGFRMLRLGTKLALVGGAAFAVFKAFRSRQAPETLGPASPVPAPPRRVPPAAESAPAATAAAGPTEASPDGAGAPSTRGGDSAPEPARGRGSRSWVDPDDGACPATHPIKAKLSSGIYHLPGMVAYERTAPDRCYVAEDAAQADGLRRSKR